MMIQAVFAFLAAILFLCCLMIGSEASKQAAKTDCDLRGSIVLQGVVYECKLKETR